MRCLDMVVKIAEKQRAKIALVDNIYAYGRQSTNRITEETRKEPQTKKGKIRLAMENKLKESNIPSFICLIYMDRMQRIQYSMKR
ncbi:hypothetical protein [Lysinibacillus sp. RS10]|uniref:hypothetical protein n=2 Tax=unclassified Lysinibacillus TaxID=2636778 RepID=UPI0035C0159C